MTEKFVSFKANIFVQKQLYHLAIDSTYNFSKLKISRFRDDHATKTLAIALPKTIVCKGKEMGRRQRCSDDSMQFCYKSSGVDQRRSVIMQLHCQKNLGLTRTSKRYFCLHISWSDLWWSPISADIVILFQPRLFLNLFYAILLDQEMNLKKNPRKILIFLVEKSF